MSGVRGSRAKVVVGLLLALQVVTGTAVPANAATSTEVVQGEVLRLVSVADWDAASRLLPGQPVFWDVTVSAAAAEPGAVTIGISATGDAELLVDARLCSEPWAGGGCSGVVTPLRSGGSLPRDGAEVRLLEMTDADVAHLRLELALDGAELGSTQVRVHARGAGESAVVGPDGGLATTGQSPVVLWAWGAGGALVLAGVVLASEGRRVKIMPRSSEGSS